MGRDLSWPLLTGNNNPCFPSPRSDSDSLEEVTFSTLLTTLAASPFLSFHQRLWRTILHFVEEAEEHLRKTGANIGLKLLQPLKWDSINLILPPLFVLISCIDPVCSQRSLILLYSCIVCWVFRLLVCRGISKYGVTDFPAYRDTGYSDTVRSLMVTVTLSKIPI